MEQVLKTLSYGPKTFNGKTRLQACCARIVSPDQLESLLNYMSKNEKLESVTDKILAFRTDSEEGYDDGVLVGAGEKLLHMVERMNVDNIVLMIFLWDYGYIGKQGTDVFKVILDNARNLIISLHSKDFKIKPEASKPVVANKFFSFEEIPEAKRNLHTRAVYRPGHFMADREFTVKESYVDEERVSESELYSAINQVERALKTLTQSDIIELRTSSSNQNVMKVLQMICILKGYNASTWNNIKEMLDSRTFKIELGMIDVFKITRRQAQIVKGILKENSKLSPSLLSRVSLPAATLLDWVQGIMTWYSGRNIVKNMNIENMEMRRTSMTNPVWAAQAKNKSDLNMDEEGDEDLLAVKKIKNSPDLEDKLRKTRELKVEYEERIERILKTRLDEVNFEGDRVDLTDEDIINYLGTQSLQEHPTSVLLALVDKLKERRLNEALS